MILSRVSPLLHSARVNSVKQYFKIFNKESNKFADENGRYADCKGISKKELLVALMWLFPNEVEVFQLAQPPVIMQEGETDNRNAQCRAAKKYLGKISYWSHSSNLY